jgi:hypothetical protein
VWPDTLRTGVLNWSCTSSWKYISVMVKQKCSEKKNLAQRQFVHRIRYTYCTGTEPVPPKRNAELYHGLGRKFKKPNFSHIRNRAVFGLNIVTCKGVVRDYRRPLDWMIGFIDTLYIPLGTTGNYSAIAVLHTLQFTVTHALGFSVFTSLILATDL